MPHDSCDIHAFSPYLTQAPLPCDLGIARSPLSLQNPSRDSFDEHSCLLPLGHLSRRILRQGTSPEELYPAGGGSSATPPPTPSQPDEMAPAHHPSSSTASRAGDPALSSLRAHPITLESLCRTGLAPDPKSRPRSAPELSCPITVAA